MNIDITIRKARSSDAPGIKACVEDAYRHYIPRIGKPPGPMLDSYPEVIRKHQVYIAEYNEQIVGVLVLIREKDSILLDNVAVHPVHQGRGLGGRLVALAESEAKKQGYSHLDLYTHERMTENIGIYTHLGYLETDRRTERGYQRVYMRKVIV